MVESLYPFTKKMKQIRLDRMETLSKEKPDTIISDIYLPKLNGLVLL